MTTVAGAFLTIFLAAGGYSATRSYLAYTELTRASEEQSAACEQMLQADALNEIQVCCRAHAGAAHALDQLLDANIESIKSQLNSPDQQARSMAQAALKHIAHRRSQAESMNGAWSANNL